MKITAHACFWILAVPDRWSTYTGTCLLLISAFLCGCSQDNREDRRRSAGADPTFEQLLAIADPKAGAIVFSQCLACHTIEQGSPDRAGPNLYGIFGKRIAEGSAQFGYTGALKSVGGNWDAQALDRWLTSPARFAPGTSMTFAGLSDPMDRADVIAYLQSQPRE